MRRGYAGANAAGYAGRNFTGLAYDSGSLMSGRYALGMEVGGGLARPGRDRPRPDRPEDEDRWSQIGRTQAWCWQQGCMLQWRRAPLARSSGTRAKTTRLPPRAHVDGGSAHLPHAVYSLSPDGGRVRRLRRIQDMQPGYGYAGLLV